MSEASSLLVILYKFEQHTWVRLGMYSIANNILIYCIIQKTIIKLRAIQTPHTWYGIESPQHCIGIVESMGLPSMHVS